MPYFFYINRRALLDGACWRATILFFALVLGCGCAEAGTFGADAQVNTHCDPDARVGQLPGPTQWAAAPEAKVVVALARPCWIQVAPFSRGGTVDPSISLLIDESMALDIQAFSTGGTLLARSAPGLANDRAIVAGRVVLLDQFAASTDPILIHIALNPSATEFKEIEIQLQWVKAPEVLASVMREMSVNILAAGALALVIFLSCALAFALRRPLYALGGCASLVNVMYLLGNNGGYRVLDFPVDIFAYQGPLLLLCFGMLLLFIVEFCDFRQFSRVTAYVLLALALLFLMASVVLLIKPDAFVGFDLYEWLRLPTYLLILHGLVRAMLKRQTAAYMCLAALVPDYVYLGFYTLPHLHWVLGDTVMVKLPAYADAGSAIELAVILWLPFMLCLALTHRVLTMERERARGALTDALTGLPNRAGLSASMAGQTGNFTVIVLDLNRFKSIDMALGRALGDQVLQGFAMRLKQLPSATVARLHSDRFALVVPGSRSVSSMKLELEALLLAPLKVEGQVVDLSATLGLSNARSPAPLEHHLRYAEVALHQARQQHVAALSYDLSMEKPKRSDLSLMSDLHKAVSNQELRLYLQPKVSLADGSVSAAEGLVRWLHPERGLVPPNEFVIFAEQIGRIGIITQWVLQQAMEIVVRQRALGRPLQISVNISAVDLSEENFVDDLVQLTQKTGAEPGDIQLEITESAAMENPERALAAMHRLHLLGFQWALDDFGTGYSSLSYLKKMPLSELKIDRSFLKDVAPNSDASRLLGSVIALGHQLGLTVVAEGAETQTEWELLQKLGADKVQGWYAAKAMPEEAYFEWCQAHPQFPA